MEPRQAWKAVQLNYDDLQEAVGGQNEYCLSERTFRMLLASCEYLHWKTRYYSLSDQEIDLDAVDAWAALAEHELMQSAPDKPSCRSLPEGIIIKVGEKMADGVKASPTDFVPQSLIEKIKVEGDLEVELVRGVGVETIVIRSTYEPPAPSFSVGDYKYSAQTTNHDGWIYCDNTEYLKADYPALYDLIGDAFDDGVTDADHFHVPIMRGMLPMVVGDLGNGINYELGTIAGQNFVALGGLEVPAHTHPLEASSGVDLRKANGGVTSSATGLVPGGIFVTGAAIPLTTLPNEGGASHENRPPILTIGNLFIYSGVVS